MPYSLANEILMQVRHYSMSTTLLIKFTTQQRITRQVQWSPHNDDWISFNTDDVMHFTWRARRGGVLRNSHGSWVGGFTKNLGRCAILVAEL